MVISLDTLPPPEAATLLARLAARSGVGATDPAVGEITQSCGYLPLAIGMLAGQLRHHPAWTTAGLAAELSSAKERLELIRAENVSVAAAFGLSYQDLTPGTQRLFRRLGLSPSQILMPTPSPPSTAQAWTKRAVTSVSCMTSTCSRSPRPAGTGCMTCFASTPARWPPPTIPPSPAPL